MGNFIGVFLLVIVAVLVSSKIIRAQPEAKKVCLYPKTNSSNDIKLEDLKPGQGVCFDDDQTISAFNSATTSLFKLSTYQGGIYGTFTDKKNELHLIIIGMSNGVIVDIINNKTYKLEDEKMQKKWYDAVNITLSKIDSLE